jgi:hypothetical protein
MIQAETTREVQSNLIAQLFERPNAAVIRKTLALRQGTHAF